MIRKAILFTLLSFLCAVSAPQAQIITFDDPDLSAWRVDRGATLDMQVVSFDGDNRLQINIGPPKPEESFYTYQGYAHQVDGKFPTSSIYGDLYLDSQWDHANVGIWGVVRKPQESTLAYPLLAWQTGPDTEAGFYTWNTFEGRWDLVSQADYALDAWHTIRMTHTDDTMSYYVDENLIYTQDLYDYAGWELQSIILNSRNYGNSYTAMWDNVGTAPTPTPEPSTMALMTLGFAGVFFWKRRR
jgi:hypothetical protein